MEAGAERGVDHEVARRQRTGSVRGQHRDGTPAPREVSRRDPSVVPVVALAGDDDDATPVTALHEVEGRQRDGTSRPADQHLEADARHRGRVGGRHLGGGEDGQHR